MYSIAPNLAKSTLFNSMFDFRKANITIEITKSNMAVGPHLKFV